MLRGPRALLALLALALCLPPVFAHAPAGTPKTHCESLPEWFVHDYGGPGPGNVLSGRDDGNVADCNGDATPGDFDGHSEYAVGGAYLGSTSGDGVTSGTLACFGELAHHWVYPTVFVEDAALGGNVAFVVAADHTRPELATGGLDCGDGIVEPCDPTDLTEIPGVTCNPQDRAIVGAKQPVGAPYAAVDVPFPPGPDGAYLVFVARPSTQGHVWATNATGFPPGDLGTVWPGQVGFG